MHTCCNRNILRLGVLKYFINLFRTDLYCTLICITIMLFGSKILTAGEPEIAVNLTSSNDTPSMGLKIPIKIIIENRSTDRVYVYFNPDFLEGVSLESPSRSIQSLGNLSLQSSGVIPAQLIEPKSSYIACIDVAKYFKILSSGVATLNYMLPLDYKVSTSRAKAFKHLEVKGSVQIIINK